MGVPMGSITCRFSSPSKVGYPRRCACRCRYNRNRQELGGNERYRHIGREGACAVRVQATSSTRTELVEDWSTRAACSPDVEDHRITCRFSSPSKVGETLRLSLSVNRIGRSSVEMNVTGISGARCGSRPRSPWSSPR
jgi:hypothetical protein